MASPLLLSRQVHHIVCAPHWPVRRCCPEYKANTSERAALELPAHVKIPRKTIRYECVGGPRDGDLVLIQRTRQDVRLDGALYHVRLWTKMDERGQRLLWKREALVWEGLLVSESNGDANLQPTPPQPVDWPPRDG